MRNRNRSRSPASQIVAGLLVIGMGLLFLLDNLNIISFHRAIAFWPMMFILVGLVKLFDTDSPNNYLVGGIFLALGVFMTANRLGFLFISWQTLWPLFLIVVGAMVLFRAFDGRRHQAGADKDAMASGVAWTPQPAAGAAAEASADALVDITAILGGFERSITSQQFRGGDVTAILGGCALDMRGASIDGEAVIDVFAFMGGVTIKCPPDWTVVLNGTPILGGFEEKTAHPVAGTKRLVVKGYAIMGGVEVRN
ncbi:MAG: LiaI-LiaF-like domain-containing protein [Telluria sp.]